MNKHHDDVCNESQQMSVFFLVIYFHFNSLENLTEFIISVVSGYHTTAVFNLLNA